jgi:hypothetical protein
MPAGRVCYPAAAPGAVTPQASLGLRRLGAQWRLSGSMLATRTRLDRAWRRVLQSRDDGGGGPSAHARPGPVLASGPGPYLQGAATIDTERTCEAVGQLAGWAGLRTRWPLCQSGAVG